MLLLLAPIAVIAAGSPQLARPTQVDWGAMREAMGSASEGPQFPSAASYSHFLKARLAHDAGNRQVALDQLRLALATDEASAFLMVSLAREYADGGELRRAELELEKVLAGFPGDASAHLLMGRILAESKKLKQARGHLERAIKLAPKNPDAYLVLAQALMEQGLVEEAVKTVERLGGGPGGDPVGYRRLGVALAERGDGERSEKLLRKAVERDQGDVESWATLARIYESTFRPKRALEAWGRAAQEDPENKDVLLSAGRVALRLGNAAEAGTWFDRLLDLDADPEAVVRVAFSYLAGNQLERALQVLDRSQGGAHEPRLHFYSGLVNERLRRFTEAAAAFEQVSLDSDLYDEARLHRAQCFSSLGQHEAALELLERIAAERPALVGLELSRARALERAGQADAAEAALARAFAREASPEVVEAITAFYQRQGRLAEAIRLFRAASSARPSDEVVRFALAVALEKAGDWRTAVDILKEQTQASPAAANFVGYALAQHGQELDRALVLVERALDSKPDSSAFLDSVGWVWFRRGDPRRALSFLLKAIDSAPEEPTLLEHLGEVLLKHGRTADARSCFQRAAQELAANPEAAERPSQRADLENRLRSLSPGRRAR